MTTLNVSTFDALPDSAYLRESELIGKSPVTPEQAAANRSNGKGPKRARLKTPRLVPFSSATLWRGVQSGRFPKPVKLSERVTAWRVGDIRAYLEAQAKGVI